MRRSIWGVAALLLVASAGAAAASRQRIDSHWRDRDIVGGRGGGWGGRGGMGGGRGGFDELKPLKAWATVQLAAQ